MSTTLKVILALVIGVVLVVVAVVGLAVYWWSRHSQELIESGRQAYTEGKEYGAKVDKKGCLTEAISRHKAKSGFKESISTNLFLRSCLKSSRPTAGFCDGVPKTSEIIKSVQWQREQCTQADLSDDTYCGQLFTQVQQHCEEDTQPR